MTQQYNVNELNNTDSNKVNDETKDEGGLIVTPEEQDDLGDDEPALGR